MARATGFVKTFPYLSQELHMQLGHSVNCLWPLDSKIWCRIPRCLWAKRSHGAWTEEPQVVLTAELCDVVKALHIYLQGLGHILFSNGTHDGTEVHQPINAFIDDNGLKVLEVQDVCIDVRS